MPEHVPLLTCLHSPHTYHSYTYIYTFISFINSYIHMYIFTCITFTHSYICYPYFVHMLTNHNSLIHVSKMHKATYFNKRTLRCCRKTWFQALTIERKVRTMSNYIAEKKFRYWRSDMVHMYCNGIMGTLHKEIKKIGKIYFIQRRRTLRTFQKRLDFLKARFAGGVGVVMCWCTGAGQLTGKGGGVK